MRTTIDIDPTVLKELKRRARAEGTTLGALVSRLAARALREERAAQPDAFEWRTAPMRALVELRDKEALYRTLDRR